MTGDKEKIHQISEGVLMFVYKCSRFIIYGKGNIQETF